MKKITSKEIVTKLNKALWVSLTSKSLVSENHCRKIFLLRNEMTDKNISFIMDGGDSKLPFSRSDRSVLNLLSANIGNIFYLNAEINRLSEIEDFEHCAIIKECVDAAMQENIQLGDMLPKGIDFFYSKKDGIHLKFCGWFLIENLIMHKCGILVDMSVNPPDFLE